MSRPVSVVAHTHWDREWYAPFEAVRARLARTLDEVLRLLTADPAFRHFLLDGQVAAIDDRRGAEERDQMQLRSSSVSGLSVRAVPVLRVSL